MPTMTTKETLDFYASVILPSEWSKHKKHERVMEVLNAVGLGNAHKTLVSLRTAPGSSLWHTYSPKRLLILKAGMAHAVTQF